jgi:hypothetical protein
MEFPINKKEQRIDIVMSNTASYGFFNDIINKNKIHAPYIIIECKNYESGVGNEELNQICSRFSKTRGEFGFLISRNSENEDELFQKCVNRRRDKGECIIPLSDKDIINMLKLKLYDESIDDFLSERLQKLDFDN